MLSLFAVVARTDRRNPCSESQTGCIIFARKGEKLAPVEGQLLSLPLSFMFLSETVASPHLPLGRLA